MAGRFLLTCTLVAFLISCGKPPQESPDASVSYDIKNFRVESKGGCQPDTTSCAYYEVNYPVFTGLDSTVTKRLQQEIDAAVSMGNPEVAGKSMPQIADEFIRSYEDFKKEIPAEGSGWSYKANIHVAVLTDTLLSLSVEEVYYTGGAHGGAGTYFINIKPSTGEKYTLEDLLKPGFKEPLTIEGERIFRNVRALPDTASFQDNGFEFPDDKFVLSQNYGFDKKGIVFYYNSYEIAPYAAGPTEVVIPYEVIRNWLKPQPD
jgi:hypothetical protein